MSEVEMQNLLDAITESLNKGQDGYALRLAQTDPNTTSLMNVILSLRHMFKPQQPSDRFMRQLKRDLMGEAPSLVERLAGVPARVHLATGIAAGVAGLMLLLRRNTRDARKQNNEMALPQET